MLSNLFTAFYFIYVNKNEYNSIIVEFNENDRKIIKNDIINNEFNEDPHKSLLTESFSWTSESSNNNEDDLHYGIDIDNNGKLNGYTYSTINGLDFYVYDGTNLIQYDIESNSDYRGYGYTSLFETTSNGKKYVAYYQGSTGVIYCKVFDGFTWSSRIQVSDGLSYACIEGMGASPINPNRHFYMWHDYKNGGYPGRDVWFREYNGTEWKSAVQISDNGALASGAGFPIEDNNGDIYVIYCYGADSNPATIHCRKYTRSTDTWSSSTQIFSQTLSDGRHDIAGTYSTSSNKIYAIFNYDYNLYLLTYDGSWHESIIRTNLNITHNSQHIFAISCDRIGNPTVVYTDEDALNNPHIYMIRSRNEGLNWTKPMELPCIPKYYYKFVLDKENNIHYIALKNDGSDLEIEYWKGENNYDFKLIKTIPFPGPLSEAQFVIGGTDFDKDGKKEVIFCFNTPNPKK